MALVAICAIALAFGFVGSMPLAGPVSVMVVSRAAARRFGEALRIGVGAAVAEGIYAGVAYWGFTTLLSRHAVVVPISHGATAVVLLALGVRFLFWRAEDRKDEREHKAGTLALGFSVSAVNPTLLLTWSAVVAFVYSKGLGRPSALDAIPFGACAGGGVAGWFAALVALLRKYEGKVPRSALTWTVRTMGLALVGLGVWSGVQLVKWAGGHHETPAGTAASVSWWRGEAPSVAGAHRRPRALRRGHAGDPARTHVGVDRHREREAVARRGPGRDA